MAEIRFLVVFAGFGTVLLSATSAVLSYIVLREASGEDYTTAIVFLGAFSVIMSFASLLYTMWAGFGRNTFLGMDAITGVPLLMLFAIIMMNAAIWQFKANDTFR